MVTRLLFIALLVTTAAAFSQAPFAVVGGTVFRDSGFALAGAEITLEPDPPATPGTKAKVKKLKSASSPRGEFTFRVPPVAARYRVTVSAKGFQSADKVVEVAGGAERVDATFTLAPESKH